MPRFRSVAVAFVLLGALSGCTKKEGVIPRRSSIDFRVDARRLGDRFELAGSWPALRAPIGWDALPDSLIVEAMRRPGGYPEGFDGSRLCSIAVVVPRPIYPREQESVESSSGPLEPLS